VKNGAGITYQKLISEERDVHVERVYNDGDESSNEGRKAGGRNNEYPKGRTELELHTKISERNVERSMWVNWYQRSLSIPMQRERG